jgi:hypothetical protein
MNKTTYIADGVAVDGFYFNFPFFQDEDVRVTLDGRLLGADEYGVHANEAGDADDAPYGGGGIEFAAAPAAGAEIAIFRSLKLQRVIDYQPTLPISQTMLNRDMNFFIEVMKEFDERLKNLQL